MPEHRWSILCERAIVDQSSNTVSIHTVVDDLQVGGLPPEALAGGAVLPHQLQLVTLWRRSDDAVPETLLTRLAFINPDEEVLGHSQETVTDLRQYIQLRSFATLPGFLVRGRFGVYHLAVEWRRETEQNWLVADRVPVTLTEGPAPSTPPFRVAP
jgi:hypothetical protein